MAESTWLARTLWALAVAVAWVAMEMIVSRLFTGFPWTALGITQHRLLPVIQLATVAGVPGVTFLVVWLSTALFVAGVRLAHRLAGVGRHGDAAARRPLAAGPGHRSGPDLLVSLRFALMTDLGLPLLALLAVTFWGARQLVAGTPAARELKLVLVQPSIPQRLIWDPRETTNRFQTLMTLSEAALRTGPDLLVWPEASLPDYSPENFRALTNLVARHRVWMILGADDAAPRAEGGFDVFNSALLFDPAGRYVASYRKQRLVIFGEYIPLVRWLPFVKYLTPIEGGFTPGEGPVTFELSSPSARISPLICFEDVFARGVRHHVEPGTDFLLNLTNDGWFGEGSAQWQQAANAVFRAVENRRPLIRCTNNGLTCWIDEFGRLREALGSADGTVYAAGFLSLRLPLPAVGEEMPATFYRQHGDVFGWACAGLTLAMAACRALSGRWRSPLTRAAGRV
jgi:apolipoprotein N-acyltransferase